MILAFVESVKYVGHMVPLAFLRIFFGYYYLSAALGSHKNGFLQRSNLVGEIRHYLPVSQAPDWFRSVLEACVLPNPQVFVTVLVVIQVVIGVSYLIGYLVRPLSMLAILFCVFLLWSLGPASTDIPFRFLIAIHLMLGWIGAGRCLGFDYFFYKRRRGIWW
jgi:thiosulfate dehydrogenase [quinone] large subunit